MDCRLTRIVLSGVLLIAACRTGAQPVVTTAPVIDSSPEAWVIMERGPCFGTCPVYALRIAESGTFEYEGKRFVQTTGRVQATMSSADLAYLKAAVARAELEKMAPRYVSGETACGLYATDMPSVVLTVTTRGSTTRIQHDFGCSGAPAQLRTLYQAIDSATHVSRWNQGAAGNQEK